MSQEPPPAPQPGPVHHKLAMLAGAWVGEENLSPTPAMPEGGRAKGEVTNTMAFNNMALIHNYNQIRDGHEQEPFHGHGVFQVIPNSDQVVLTWFDQMGRFEFVGKFEGDNLFLDCQLPDGQSRCLYRLNGPDEYQFTMSISQDGQSWTPFITSTYRKAG